MIHHHPAPAVIPPLPGPALYMPEATNQLVMGLRRPTPRPVSVSAFMTRPQAVELINASTYADKIGCPLTAHVTVHWAMSSAFSESSAIISPRKQMAFQGALFEKAIKWLKRKGLERVAYTWTREWTRQKHIHTHWRLNLPRHLWDEFKMFLLCSGNFSHDRLGLTGEAIRITGGSTRRRCSARGARTSGERTGQLLYVLKALKPTTRLPGTTDGVFDPLGIGTEQGLPIRGKRCGTSQTISSKARADGGWQDVRSWAALDAMVMAERAPWWEKVPQ